GMGVRRLIGMGGFRVGLGVTHCGLFALAPFTCSPLRAGFDDSRREAAALPWFIGIGVFCLRVTLCWLVAFALFTGSPLRAGFDDSWGVMAGLPWSALLPTTALTLFALLRIGPRLTCWTASAFGMGVRRLIGMGGFRVGLGVTHCGLFALAPFTCSPLRAGFDDSWGVMAGLP
ncbi:hypothetical protein O7A70_32580, partial [Mesorhizobium sp. Cs1299R1N1]|uniref:hypothetical protein n=1 Tax=Mesorhizobium sp. Cs1299R1N1 TaxID=3015172 RepID=UPI00301CC68C